MFLYSLNCSTAQTYGQTHHSKSASLQKLHWLPVHDMLRYRDAVLMYKCLRGLAPLYLSKKFSFRPEVLICRTRNKKMLIIPLYRTATGQRYSVFRVV